MPAKSASQRKLVFAKRGEYGNESQTPADWKWVWDNDWEKIEENIKRLIGEKKKCTKRKMTEEEKFEFKDFFNLTLNKFGIKSPKELSGDKAKEFYNYISKNWKSKQEVVTEEDQISEVSVDSDDINIVRDIVKDELAKFFKVLWLKRTFWERY